MDPIADMLTKIRNALLVRKKKVKIVPFSKFKFILLKVLEREKFLEKVEKRGKYPKNYILVYLKYTAQGKPVISGLKRVSKSSQRIYLRAKKIRPVKQGYGLSIISTSKGLLTDKEARKYHLGGEVICEVW
ncbi:MAG: 30S ribosomal protein S8 [Minisyncoccales bacterium]